MKIKQITINRFKRFSDLTVREIPESVKLVLLVGPNGSGKTSLFEAFNHWYMWKGFHSHNDKIYIEKTDGIEETSESSALPRLSQNWFENKVKIEFHTDEKLDSEKIKEKFYFRTAYRNESDFNVAQLNRQNDPTKQLKLGTLMQNDITVSENYQRLISRTLSGIYCEENNAKTVEQLREELIGKIKISLNNVFDDLKLSSIGDPLSNGSFFFEKGISKNFHYKNLSAGEKSVFDLLLDMIMKSDFFPDAVFCIDEPEAHMHTRLQSKVLKELYNLTPSNSQLWISTHSIGMLKQAEELEQLYPGSVAFLDFDNRDFDLTETIVPTRIDKTIWDKFMDLALADFSQLIAPKQIVFCEGSPTGRKYKDFDAQIYTKIFEQKYRDTKFISLGSCTEIENLGNESIKIVSKILESSHIVKFIDRDNRSTDEVGELLKKGIKTSQQRNIESYLLSDELIIKLCESQGRSDLIGECLAAKYKAIEESIARGNPNDDIKSASGEIFNVLKRILGLSQCGNNKCAFLRDTMTPLVSEDIEVYKNLEKEIFG